MGALGDLPKLEADWQGPFADIHQPDWSELGAFGHPHQRRLGVRGESRAWALLSRSAFSAYALAVELSATGLVLEFVGRRFRLVFRPHLHFRLDLFVPEASSHIRAAVRSVRPIGDRQAFEFVEIAAADRLTLAEYLDRLMTDSTGTISPSKHDGDFHEFR